MARIPYPRPEDLADRTREVLARLPQLNIFRMLAHAQPVFPAWLRFGGALLTDGALDPGLRELAILVVADVRGARYEWVQHEAIALTVGVDRVKIDAVRDGDLDASAFSAVESAVLHFTAEIATQGHAAEPALEAVRTHLGDADVVELLLVAGQYLMLASVMLTLDIDLDEPAGPGLLRRR